MSKNVIKVNILEDKIISLRNLFHQSAPDFSEQTLVLNRVIAKNSMK